MRDCKRHPSQSQPGGGVCASCLQERLTWLWRGESFRPDDTANPVATSQEAGVDVDVPQLRDDARNPLGVGSLATVRKQLQVNGVTKPGDPRNGDGATTGARSDGEVATTGKAASKDVIVEWAEFHARRRRRNLELGLDNNSSKSPMAKMSRSLDSLEFKPLVDRLMDTDTDNTAHRRELIPRVSILTSAEKIRSRSMPLDNRSAEETALRVIREQPDHLYSDELDFLDTGLQSKVPGEQRHRLWRIRKSPKWVKMFVRNVTTSRNKVFPSRVGSRKRLTRFASADWSHTVEANGDSTKSSEWIVAALRGVRAKEAILSRKLDGMGQQRQTTSMRSSVFSWYQVLILSNALFQFMDVNA